MTAALEAQRVQAARRLPGMSPVGQADWITVSNEYADQMSQRVDLIALRQTDVFQQMPDADDAAEETLEHIRAILAQRADFDVRGSQVLCPDGRGVETTGQPPLLALGQILQEDLCIHLKIGDHHHLMGAILCFPATWTLREKIGKPLPDIHRPIAAYDSDLAKRVQRLFDGIQVGQPLWRANYLTFADPTLFQPQREADRRETDPSTDRFIRSERQTLFRLPQTQAVVFAIHTTVAPLTSDNKPL